MSDASKQYRLFGGNWPIQITHQFDRRFDRFEDDPIPGWFKWSNRIRTVTNQFDMIFKIMCKLFLTIRCGSIFWRKKILIWMEWFILLMISIEKWFEWKKKNLQFIYCLTKKNVFFITLKGISKICLWNGSFF